MNRRSVILRHDLPDGSWHYDWVIEREANEERRLLTFRMGVRPDAEGFESGEAELIGDHRAAYLEFEGDIGGGRGIVRKVSEGRVHKLIEAEPILAEIEWETGIVRHEIRRLNGRGRVIVKRVSPDPKP